MSRPVGVSNKPLPNLPLPWALLWRALGPVRDKYRRLASQRERDKHRVRVRDHAAIWARRKQRKANGDVDG